MSSLLPLKLEAPKSCVLSKFNHWILHYKWKTTLSCNQVPFEAFVAVSIQLLLQLWSNLRREWWICLPIWAETIPVPSTSTVFHLWSRDILCKNKGHIHSCKFENKKQGCWKYDFMSLQHGQGASRTDFSKYVKRYNCKQVIKVTELDFHTL